MIWTVRPLALFLLNPVHDDRHSMIFARGNFAQPMGHP